MAIDARTDLLALVQAAPPAIAAAIAWEAGVTVLSAPFIRGIHWAVDPDSNGGAPGAGDVTLVIQGRTTLGGVSTSWETLETVSAAENALTHGTTLLTDTDAFGVFNEFQATWVAANAAATSIVAIKLQQER